MSHPLLTRLYDDYGVKPVTQQDLNAVCTDDKLWILFFPGPMQQYPESLDVAVILPEIMKLAGGKVQGACIEVENETALRERFPFDFYPALVFVKQGTVLDTLCKVQDWSVYREHMAQVSVKAQHLIPLQSQAEEPQHA